MAFRSALIGLISLGCAVAPVWADLASAHHPDRYNDSYYEGGYYGDFYGGPYAHSNYAPYSPYSYDPVDQRDSGGRPGYRCYYRGKDGSCMNYSYQHGPSYGWGEGYGYDMPLYTDPFIAAPYGYDGYSYDNYGYQSGNCRRHCNR